MTFSTKKGKCKSVSFFTICHQKKKKKKITDVKEKTGWREQATSYKDQDSSQLQLNNKSKFNICKYIREEKSFWKICV